MKIIQEQLSPEHWEMLTKESGISEEVVAARGYWTATDPGELKQLGFADYQARVPALVIPIHTVNGLPDFHRIRPDDPRSDRARPHRKVKYDQPAGAGLALDVPTSTGALDDTSRRLFIVEGERKADSVASRDECVIGLLGVWGWKYNGMPRPDWDHIPLVGREVIVCFDSDVLTNVGVRASERALVEYLVGRGADIRVARIPHMGDGEKRGVDDYLANGADLEDLLETCTPAAKITYQKEGWPALNVAALHGIAGDVVRALEPNTEADPAALLIDFLASVGNIIGRGAYWEVEGDRHYAKIWPVLVGPSSTGRKGVAQGRVNRVIEKVDEDWTLYNMTTGLSSGEGVIHHTRDKVERKNKDDELEVVDNGVFDKRIFVEEPEFSQVLTLMERQGSILSGILRQAWDNRPLSTLTKNNSERSTGSHVTIVGHVTPDDIRKNLTGERAQGGVGNRFIYMLVRRSKSLPFGGKNDDLPPNLIEDLQSAIAAGKVERSLLLSEEVEDLWGIGAAQMYANIYEDLTSERPGLYGMLVSRAAPNVIRLALIYAVLDQARAIEINHLIAALSLWEYSEASVYYLFAGRTGDALADEIVALLDIHSAEGCTTTDISDHFGRNVPSSRLQATLEALEEVGLIESEREKTGSRGRPTTRWFRRYDDEE
jgi:hypothetical protein